MTFRSSALFSSQSSSLLFVDLQPKLLAAIPNAEAIVATCRFLADGARLLEIPIEATEQNPEKLGRTIPELAGAANSCPSKMRFSASPHPAYPPTGELSAGRSQVVIAGIEAHVCVLQTALDLLGLGYQVAVVIDATGSRRSTDADVALQRMRDQGVTITTSESILFEWCETAEAGCFRELSKLVKGRTISGLESST